MFPVFRKERTVHSRRDICCHHGRLNRKRTASAERIYQDPVFIPWSEHDQCRRKRLCDRSLHCHLAVASFVQGHTGSIDADGCHIFHKSHTDREACAVFLEPGYAVNTLQTFYNGFFHNRLNIRWAEQFTFY